MDDHPLRQRQQQLAGELAALDRFSKAIHNPRDTTALFRLFYDEASQVLPIDAFFIAQILPNRTQFQTQLSIDKGIEYLDSNAWPFSPNGPSGFVVGTGTSIVFKDLNPELNVRFPAVAAQNTSFGDEKAYSRAWMMVPILRYNEVIGVVCAQSYQFGVYDAQSERFLSTLAGMLALGMHQGQLLDQLQITQMALSVPLIPLSETHLLLALVGVLDSRRMLLIQTTLLQRIQGSRVRYVLISMVAIQGLDEQGLAAFMRMTRAVELLGAQCVLAGMSPQLSLQLSSAGSALNRLVVYPSLLHTMKALRLVG